MQKINSQVDQLLERGDPVAKAELEPLSLKLKQLQILNDSCLVQEEKMRLKLLALMRERNLFLEKCRAIERFGTERGWQGSNLAEQTLLDYINDILYQRQEDQDSQDD